MKMTWIIPIIIFIQCTHEIEEMQQPQNVYLTDTIYIEKEFVPEKMPWELECIDSAWTNLDMNVCSLECLEVADSVLEEKYNDILKSYEEKLLKTKDQDYVEIYPDHTESLKKQKQDFKKLSRKFKELRTTLEALINNAMGDARLTHLYRNSYILGIVENQIELYDNLEREIF